MSDNVMKRLLAKILRPVQREGSNLYRQQAPRLSRLPKEPERTIDLDTLPCVIRTTLSGLVHQFMQGMDWTQAGFDGSSEAIGSFINGVAVEIYGGFCYDSARRRQVLANEQITSIAQYVNEDGWRLITRLMANREILVKQEDDNAEVS